MILKEKLSRLGASVALLLAVAASFASKTSASAAFAPTTTGLENSCFRDESRDGPLLECRNLTNFLAAFPENTKSLVIYDSTIRQITNELHHENLRNLQYFTLRGAQLEFIHPGAFRKNKYLKTADVSNNSIVDLPVTLFSEQKHMKSVDATKNDFSDDVCNKMTRDYLEAKIKLITSCKIESTVTETTVTTKLTGETITTPETITPHEVDASTSALTSSAPAPVPSEVGPSSGECNPNDSSNSNWSWWWVLAIFSGLCISVLIFVCLWCFRQNDYWLNDFIRRSWKHTSTTAFTSSNPHEAARSPLVHACTKGDDN